MSNANSDDSDEQTPTVGDVGGNSAPRLCPLRRRRSSSLKARRTKSPPTSPLLRTMRRFFVHFGAIWVTIFAALALLNGISAAARLIAQNSTASISTTPTITNPWEGDANHTTTSDAMRSSRKVPSSEEERTAFIYNAYPTRQEQQYNRHQKAIYSSLTRDSSPATAPSFFDRRRRDPLIASFSPQFLPRASLYSHRPPYNVILILPSKESHNDKFGLTLAKARPVIDIAIEDVVTRFRLMPPGWINITAHDSRYWEDTLLAERHATTGVVQAYCERRLDAILGFADAYSLATVSKISAGFHEGGVPVLTTTGLNSQIGSKKSYPYVTRMTGSYSQMAESVYRFIAYRQEEQSGSRRSNAGKKRRRDQSSTRRTTPTINANNNNATNLNYKNLMFMYHDKRRAINRFSVQGENADDFISSHCYFSLHAIKNYFKEVSDFFKDSWKVQTPYVAFDEELSRTRAEVREWVKMASEYANGLDIFE